MTAVQEPINAVDPVSFQYTKPATDAEARREQEIQAAVNQILVAVSGHAAS
jgi:hypothetical protein